MNVRENVSYIQRTAFLGVASEVKALHHSETVVPNLRPTCVGVLNNIGVSIALR